MYGTAAAVVTLGAMMAFARVHAQTFRAEGTQLLINEYPVFELQVTLNGVRPRERVERILQTLRAAPPLKLPLRVDVRSSGHWIMSGDTIIVRATREEAARNRTNVGDLANQWRTRIEYALRLPPVQAAQPSVSLAEGGTQFVRVFGTEATEATFETSDPGIVMLERVPGGIRLVGVAVGESSVDIRTRSGRTRVAVRVLGAAAKPSRVLRAEVFGNPAGEEAVRDAVVAAIRAQLETADGATIEVLEVPAATIPSGSETLVTARVRVRAPNRVPFEGPVQVRVVNPMATRERETALWYSNHPERVERLGTLFAATLEARKPVRMLYHHLNGTLNPLAVKVALSNPSDAPARVMLVRGDAEPNRDPVVAGFEAGDRFLTAWQEDRSEMLIVPARSSLPISVRQLGREFTMSGLTYLALLPGGPASVRVTTEALAPHDLASTWALASLTPQPWLVAAPEALLYRTLTESPHIYVAPYREVDARFEVGGRFAFVRIGQSPIASVDAQRALEGNFGVLYTVSAVISNPSQNPSDVEITYEASAGYSGGVFVVDGRAVRAPRILSKEEVVLSEIRLAPGERRAMRILVLPLSGSSYPATLAIRPRLAALAAPVR